MKEQAPRDTVAVGTKLGSNLHKYNCWITLWCLDQAPPSNKRPLNKLIIY